MDAYGLAQFLFSPLREPVREASILLNDPVAAVIICIALFAALSIHYKEQKRAPFVVFAIVLALLLGMGFKAFIAEPRPCIFSPGKIPCPLDFSLPSIHALIVFTLAVVSIGNRSFPFYLLFALFTAFSRVYLGVHTIPQVAAGLALAFFACVLAEIIWKQIWRELPEGVYMTHDARRLQ